MKAPSDCYGRVCCLTHSLRLGHALTVRDTAAQCATILGRVWRLANPMVSHKICGGMSILEGVLDHVAHISAGGIQKPFTCTYGV